MQRYDELSLIVSAMQGRYDLPKLDIPISHNCIMEIEDRILKKTEDLKLHIQKVQTEMRLLKDYKEAVEEYINSMPF